MNWKVGYSIFITELSCVKSGLPTRFANTIQTIDDIEYRSEVVLVFKSNTAFPWKVFSPYVIAATPLILELL